MPLSILTHYWWGYSERELDQDGKPEESDGMRWRQSQIIDYHGISFSLQWP